MTDPPYWRRRPEPTRLERLGRQRRLLLTAGPHSMVVRPVLAGGRLLLVGEPEPWVEQLAAEQAVTLTPCDSRGEPRPDRPFDVVDPVRTSRPADPVAARVRPSPQDRTTALVLEARRHRVSAGLRSAVTTVRDLIGVPATPPLVLVAELEDA